MPQKVKFFKFHKFDLILTLIFLLISILWLTFLWNKELSNYKKRIVQNAFNAAEGLNGIMLKNLSAKSEDKNSIAYISLKERIQKIAEKSDNVRFVYFLKKTDDKLYFLVDSEPEISEDYVNPGDLFEEANEIFYRAFTENKPIVSNPIVDRWGTWVEILIPLEHELTGEVFTVFGMSYFADSFLDYPKKQLNEAVLKLFLLFALLIVFEKFLLKHLELKKTVYNLKEATIKANQCSKAAEEANQAKSRFLANMSHEIRTPLNGISGFAQILNETNLSDEQGKFLYHILKSSEILIELINQILDLSKIEAGEMKLESYPFNLKKLLNDILNMFSPKIDEKNLKLNLVFDDYCPEWISGDALRLKQILINLTGNAVKFTEKGEISIKVYAENKVENKVDIYFEVKDTGIGIPAEKVSNLFNPFYQTDDSTTRKYGGTGLGLAVTKELIELMGGKIEVESAENIGSTFKFKISFQFAEIFNQNFSEKNHIEEKKTIINSDIKILLVEDDIFSRNLIIVKLNKQNLKCDIAVNGKEAVNAVLLKKYDIILMDCQMPVMDGYTATKKIRELDNGKKTPIIAMTAHAMAGDREKCIESGMDDYVSKPVNLKILFDLIRKYSS